MRKHLVFLFAALLLVGSLTACGNTHKQNDSANQSDTQTNTTQTATSQAKSLTIKDDTDRDVTVSKKKKKMVPLDTSPFMVLSAFGKLDTIVGNHQSTQGNPLYEQLNGLPIVATYSAVNYEMLAQLQPQLVISSVRSHGVVKDQENLSGFDIEDVKLDLRNPDRMKHDITLMGQLFSCEEKAKQINAFYDKWQKFINDREKNLTDNQRVKVFLEYHAGRYKTGAPKSSFYSQVALAGGINVAKDLTAGETPEVNAEWVAKMNPDIIIREATGMGYTAPNADKAQTIYDEVVGREGLKMTKAVQNKNVHLVSVDIYSRPGYIVGVCYMAKWFYPDLFKDFNPDEVLKEYCKLFYPGKELKGVWTYDK